MLAAQSSSRYNGFGLSPQTHHSNWRLNVASIQFFKRKITQPPVHQFTCRPVHRSTCLTVHSHQSTVHSHQYTTPPQTDNRKQKTHNSPLTTNSPLRLNRVLDTMALVYRHKPITRTDRNYSPFTTHHSLLNQSTGSPLTTHDSRLTCHLSLLYYYTISM